MCFTIGSGLQTAGLANEYLLCLNNTLKQLVRGDADSHPHTVYSSSPILARLYPYNMPELGLCKYLHLQVRRLQCCLEKALVDAKLGFIAAYVTLNAWSSLCFTSKKWNEKRKAGKPTERPNKLVSVSKWTEGRKHDLVSSPLTSSGRRS